MAFWEVLLIGIALSMDAFAVGMTNGMTEPKMRLLKALCVAGMYALFQFLMPVLGYYCGYAFSSLVEKIAPWLSFGLLALIGGKMIFDFAAEKLGKKKTAERAEGGRAPCPAEGGRTKPLGAGKLFLQAVATSIDALAVGVTFLAAETTEGLPMHVSLCALVIGAVTFVLSLAAIFLGKKIGDRFSDKAELLGGVILLAIGIKILVEGLVA